MSKTKLFLIITAAMLLSGCTSEQAIKVNTLAKETLEMSASVDAIQPIALNAIADMYAENIITADQKAAYEQINANIDATQSKIVPIAEELGDADFTTAEGVIATLQTINNSTAPYNPFYGYINIALGLAATVAGIFAKKKSSEAVAAQSEAKSTSEYLIETVKGIQSFLDADKEGNDALKSELAKAQSTATKQAIAVIKKG